MSPMAKMCATLVRICLSTGMKPRSRHLDPGELRADGLAVGHAADGHQHALEHLRGRRLVAIEADAQAGGLRLDRGDLGVEEDLLVARPDAALERTHQVRIAARHQLPGELDHADLGAEGVVHARHLESDDAAADHQQSAGEFRQLQRAAGVDDARIIRQSGQPHRLRAGGDDALLEADALGAARPHDLDDVGTRRSAPCRAPPRPCAAAPAPSGRR